MTTSLGLPAATPALSRRLEKCGAEYLVTRYSGPGNPMNCEILRFGTVVATKVPFVPGNPFMNAIHGLENSADLPGCLEFYAATDQPCWIDT